MGPVRSAFTDEPSFVKFEQEWMKFFDAAAIAVPSVAGNITQCHQCGADDRRHGEERGEHRLAHQHDQRLRGHGPDLCVQHGPEVSAPPGRWSMSKFRSSGGRDTVKAWTQRGADGFVLFAALAKSSSYSSNISLSVRNKLARDI